MWLLKRFPVLLWKRRGTEGQIDVQIKVIFSHELNVIRSVPDEGPSLVRKFAQHIKL
jgi:hypothetical protein